VSNHIEPEGNPTVSHEATDADARAITRFGIAMPLGLIVVYLFLWWIFDHYAARQARLSPPVPALIREQAPKEPPEPRLQGNPQVDMKQMLVEEDAVLHHYGWVDPDRGVVRIPIERAIELAGGRGLPQFQGAGTGQDARNPGDSVPGKAFGAKGKGSR
jgi:hypothetical protein